MNNFVIPMPATLTPAQLSDIIAELQLAVDRTTRNIQSARTRKDAKYESFCRGLHEAYSYHLARLIEERAKNETPR